MNIPARFTFTSDLGSFGPRFIWCRRLSGAFECLVRTLNTDVFMSALVTEYVYCTRAVNCIHCCLHVYTVCTVQGRGWCTTVRSCWSVATRRSPTVRRSACHRSLASRAPSRRAVRTCSSSPRMASTQPPTASITITTMATATPDIMLATPVSVMATLVCHPTLPYSPRN